MAATLRRSSEATFNGADGVVWSRNSWTTPPRLHELIEASRLFLIVQPPLLPAEEGSRLLQLPHVFLQMFHESDAGLAFLIVINRFATGSSCSSVCRQTFPNEGEF